MDWKIILKTATSQLRGSGNINKMKYIVTNGNKEFVVLYWPGAPCIIYDRIHDDILVRYNWCYMKHTGYAYAHGENHNTCMHSLIMNQTPEGKTVDHINFIKTFNVNDNLRFATQGEQNINRENRKDKAPPPQQLIDIGVTTLPRHIRYDHGEKKFVIERTHPASKVTSFNCSGSKSANVSIFYKYYEILKRLKGLDKIIQTPEQLAFIQLQKQLYKDYCDITFLVTGEPVTKIINYETIEYDEILSVLEQHLTENERLYERRGLPENDFIEDLPKYCCYTKAKGNRGDQFYISRHHPKLKAINQTDLKTSGSKAVTKKEKYDHILNLLKTIDLHEGDDLKKALKC
jgi:hypothetical protein